jgi:UDP-N-acetyl-D-glucosamine/UDP-N-acetyl-D-galactosamine dehydrogenase
MLKQNIFICFSSFAHAMKENCPDLLNTRVVDVVKELKEYNCTVDVYDPCVSAKEALSKYKITLVEKPQQGAYDSIILVVAHTQFRDMGPVKIHALGKKLHIVYDLKYVLPAEAGELRLR